MDMTFPPGDPAVMPPAIWRGRTPAFGATGLIASCGLAAGAIDAEDAEEGPVLGFGESWDDMGEAGDIGVLLLVVYAEAEARGIGEKTAVVAGIGDWMACDEVDVAPITASISRARDR